MFGLDVGLTLLLIICLVCVCAFEFINGFHDTANAVATVIYTNTLKPVQAVVLSGILNGIGVFVGGIAVAIAIINLLPVETLVDQNIAHSLGMVGAILITAILWNFGTWYLGIPASSSHTLIGSILGVGIAYSLLPGSGEAAVNWEKAGHVGLSLLVSPLFGFLFAVLLMMLLSRLLKKNKAEMFSEPDKDNPPPTWIRLILIGTCSAVSFSHGSNDGQKGVGLMMLILIGVVPSYFALNRDLEMSNLNGHIQTFQEQLSSIDEENILPGARADYAQTMEELTALKVSMAAHSSVDAIPANERFEVRGHILLMRNHFKHFQEANSGKLSPTVLKELKATEKSIGKFTDYAPVWVIVLIALSLGIGTMVGWKRIVVTIGEKIGKSHLSYAQGASAEMVAASTIAVSTYMGLPVSTTHVLSSGIAGTMFASGGKDNLQKSTITRILLAWVLTLPVCVFMAGTLFILFRTITG